MILITHAFRKKNIFQNGAQINRTEKCLPLFRLWFNEGKRKIWIFFVNVIRYKNEHIVSKLTKYISGNQ